MQFNKSNVRLSNSKRCWCKRRHNENHKNDKNNKCPFMQIRKMHMKHVCLCVCVFAVRSWAENFIVWTRHVDLDVDFYKLLALTASFPFSFFSSSLFFSCSPLGMDTQRWFKCEWPLMLRETRLEKMITTFLAGSVIAACSMDLPLWRDVLFYICYANSLHKFALR